MEIEKVGEISERIFWRTQIFAFQLPTQNQKASSCYSTQISVSLWCASYTGRMETPDVWYVLPNNPDNCHQEISLVLWINIQEMSVVKKFGASLLFKNIAFQTETFWWCLKLISPHPLPSPPTPHFSTDGFNSLRLPLCIWCQDASSLSGSFWAPIHPCTHTDTPNNSRPRRSTHSSNIENLNILNHGYPTFWLVWAAFSE